MESESVNLTFFGSNPPVKVISDRCSGDITINYHCIILKREEDTLRKEAERILHLLHPTNDAQL